MTTTPIWTNYFVTSLRATAKEGHLPSDQLRDKIINHDGSEAYHCAYELEERDDFSNYQGLMRPALDYVWFDFDSHDGGALALLDTRKFVERIAVDDLFICFSGSKGFHVGVPFSYFNLTPRADLGTVLNRLATHLKKEFTTLDTTIYNANRKFRALGSRHPKTGLFKIQVKKLDDLDFIKACAKERGSLEIPIAALRSPLPFFTDLLSLTNKDESLSKDNSITLDEFRRYRQHDGAQAFAQCGFLKWNKEAPSKVNESQWYAALSIVARFKDGRKQCHEMSKGHPGYSAVKTDEKIEQALQASGPRTCSGVSSLWAGCTQCPLYGAIKSPIVIMADDVIATEATGFYDLIPASESKPMKRIPNYNDLLLAFQRDRPYKTIADMKTVYTFTGTHYEETTPIEIKAFSEDKFNPKPQEKYRQEFNHKVFANQVARREFFIRTTEDRINFKNGILNLGRNVQPIGISQLEAHSEQFGFRHVLPYSYENLSRCPTFDWWINDVMLGDASLVAILQEFMGYVIRGGEYNYHKALWLSGSGRNGKSTFLSVLKALIGTGNYSTLSIRQIISDKFSSADLDGKIANFSEETSPEELSDSGPFKNLTGDGELTAQKKFGALYQFRNRAKLIMTYNEIPMLKDLSPGMLSRPIIIPWKKDLTNESNQDKKLKDKLFAELPGIFNFALEGWKRLERNEQFTQSDKSTLEMTQIKESSCSAFQFVEEHIKFLPVKEIGISIAATALYDHYKSKVGNYAYNKIKFGKRIMSHPEIALRRSHDRNGTSFFALQIKSDM